jgi:exodeoxyribonuclease V beta subunit
LHDRLRHLELCKQRFDEAAISTIHGFCKTVLSEFSHLTRTDVDVTIETEGRSALVDDAIDDFWRQYNAREATLHNGMLASLLYGPLKREELRKGMDLLLRQHQVTVLYPDPPAVLGSAEISALLDRLKALIDEISYVWQDERETIRKQLADTNISRAGLDKYFDGLEEQLFEFLSKPIEYDYKLKNHHPLKLTARFIREGALTAKNTYRTNHPIHERIGEALEIAAYIPDAEQRRALEAIRMLYLDRCARDGVTTFDALLSDVADALKDDAPENGGAGALHEGLRKRYKAGLIDEFQDTDPVQFEIFRRIFIDDDRGERLLYLIGDPKQAIYKFRGADLRTYMKARRLVENMYTLETNFRSSQNMVDGVNALFEGPYSFIDSELEFSPAEASAKDNPFVSAVDVSDAGEDGNRLGLHFPKVGAGAFGSKGKAVRAMVQWTASHIARTLSSAQSSGGISGYETTRPGTARDGTAGQGTMADETTLPGTASDGTAGQGTMADETTRPGTATDETSGFGVSGYVDGGTTRTGFFTNDGQFKPLSAGDIAVLVSSHHQARMIKASLEERGVPAVVGGDASIFSTDDARMMSLMLDVLVDPQRLGAIRTMLASRLVGMSAATLQAIQQDDLRWSEMLEIFALARDEALHKGVLAGLRHLMDALHVERCLISWSDGERRITNLRHLSELLYQEQRRGHRNLAGLAQWLRSRRSDAERNASDETQMRLESDENRVTIMTMHTSKGLQFPVVYAPFLWESRKKGRGAALYAEGESGGFVLDIKNGYSERLAQVRGGNEDRAEQGLRHQDSENIEDRVRLIYVAVTRSRFRCYVPHAMVYGPRSKGTDSAFVAMLLRDPGAGAVQWVDVFGFERSRGADGADLISELLGKLDTTRLCMYPAVTDYQVRYRAPDLSEQLSERRLSDVALHRMRQHVFVESYSSLKKHQDSSTRNADLLEDAEMVNKTELRVDSPDGDVNQYEDSPASELDYETPSGFKLAAANHDIFGFPRGAHTGNFWHHIFETLDFSDTAGHEQVVRDASAEYGFSYEQWGSVLMDMVQKVIGAGLGDFRLSDVPRNKTLREMEFHLPYNEAALDEFIRWIQQQNTPDPMSKGVKANLNLEAEAGASGSPVTSESSVRHYLKGFVDLIVEHGGRFYILDYKSDHLGSSAENYSTDLLYTHMRDNGYIMQYYFYSMALYLYLRERLGDFDFDNVFGGVRYLFLRAAGSQGDAGIYSDRPDPGNIARFAEQVQNTLNTAEYP